MGATLGVQGLEFYSGFVEDNEAFLREKPKRLCKNMGSRCRCFAALPTSPNLIPICWRKKLGEKGA